MRVADGQIQISATDLARHVACRHLTSLDLRAARGGIKRIYRNDPGLAVLEERGFRHETAYLSYLKDRGCDVLPDENGFDEDCRLQRTLDAMRSGRGAIAQADLKDGRWRGRADVLLKVDTPSNLGSWSYEIVDTKLARETRGGTVLQLCLYSELVAEIQGVMPDRMHVVIPGRQFQPETFRTSDFLAYYRFVKSRLEAEIDADTIRTTYPDPVEHCELCQWWTLCNERRRGDDHLSFVAGISKLQINELRKWDITTLANLATLPLPLRNRPERGAPETFVKVREQASLQLKYRTTSKPAHELLAPEPERGLARLPEPSRGDIFLDFEADPFVEDGGLEYLLGYVTLNGAAEPEYISSWAFDRTNERRMFQSFVDMVTERLSRYPDLHIYHFAPYEPTALKRLMGRYATREDEIDRMLRMGLLVDLHGVVRQTLRASVERYSLKDLEVFFGFKRQTDLQDAKQSLRTLECALELNEVTSIPREVRNTVESYNREDCISTLRLRNWLEELRHELVAGGMEIKRPLVAPGDPSPAIRERSKRALDLMERLLRHVPIEPSERTREQQAKWLLAHMMEFHHREEKAPWWEYFRLCGLSDEELLEERCAISGLEFVERLGGGTAKRPIDRYRFPIQDVLIRRRDVLDTADGRVGDVEAIDIAARTMDVKKTSKMADLHPTSAFVHTVVSGGELVESLFRLADWVVDHGIDGPGKYRSARDLLLRNPPRLDSGTPAQLYNPNIDIVSEGRRLASQLDHGVLPIQGPPGAGKTYTGARMACELLRAGKKVGVTAVSHKVIRRFLEEVVDAAIEENLPVRCIAKVKEKPRTGHASIGELTTNKRVVDALNLGAANLAGGTAWLWARPEFEASVDVLFVDEAGQMSLPDVLAVSQAAKSIILLGDPQQLEQPLQGTHPPGVDSSALHHVLDGHQTISSEAGLFLSETWRLAPSICDFTSELFYENRLGTHDRLKRQKLTGPTSFAGEGLFFVPVIHEGNQNSSNEEAHVIQCIVDELLRSGVAWVDINGVERPLGSDDILIVAPYNAQVFTLGDRLPNSRIGTVDKFQGQEAPVVIYSMTTSSPGDAPRGMEFLYSSNRFNVATSRARCVCILVANFLLFEPECHTPRQMKLANVLCRYREKAQVKNIALERLPRGI
jgi:predicted RecB family nuclease